MAIWPFKRRKRSTAESKRPAIDDRESLRRSSPSRHLSLLRQKSSRRSHNDRAMAYSPSSQNNDFVLSSDYGDSPMVMDHDFQHREQQSHQDRSFLYFAGQDRSGMSSSASSHRPHKQSSFIRRLSKRRKDKNKAQPPSAYESRLGRQRSKSGHPRFLPGREDDRPLSPDSTAPRTSMESQLSSRAYKIRSFDVFSPHPTLHYDDGSSPTSEQSRYRSASLTPTRSNSRRTTSRATQDWRYKGPLISVENLGDRRSRVDDLVDELDAKGIREAMERDRRRREKKKQEYEERLRLKLERRALQQGIDGNTGRGMEPEGVEQQYCRNNPGESSTVDQRDPRIGYAISGTQTPLSWFNDDPSGEDMSKEPRQFTPRPDAVTPVSMDALDEPSEGMSVVEEAPAVVVHKASPPRSKTSSWTSFIKRATAARIKKEHATRSIRTGHSTLLSDSEEEQYGNAQTEADPRTHIEVEDLRHREGQTPGRHVSSEVVLAMNALETGHIKERQENEYEDEMRDSVLPTTPMAPYHHQNGSQISSRSSLAPPSLGLRGGATTSKSHSPIDESRDSPTLPSHHPARYSPSMNRHSSGAASLENGARSIMSTSLASIDSEGSWLSGKINPRLSVQQIGPLRTSASSLRKRYHEIDDHDVSMDDGYFTGVGKPHKELNANGEIGGVRLDLDDTGEGDIDDNVSVNSEAERNMWREGMEKRVQLRNGMRTKSREGMLDDFADEPRLIDSPNERSTSPQLQTDDFATPLERPSFSGTISTSSEFKTPLEHPSMQMESYHAI